MHAEKQQGYLLLADISGFDAYLAEVELEHAQDVLAELLALVVDSLSPPMHIAGIHRDAVMAHQPAAQMPRGETLLELTETTYAAFRDRLKSIIRNNTCDCRACAALPDLDLKFLVHFGEYTTQPGEDGRVALGGLDAGLVRDRLLKDQADEGSHAYALFTEASLMQMGVRPDGLAERQGSYPHLGQVRTGSLDLGRRYRALTAERRAFVTEDEADVLISLDYPSSPAVVWDWLNDAFKRTRWLRWTKWRPGLRPGGRTDVGAINHCAHGVGVLIETVLDWRPYRYFTVDMAQDSFWFAMQATYELEPLPDGQGTRLHFRAKVHKVPAAWLARPVLRAGLSLKLKQDFERMGIMMAEEQQAIASPAAVEEQSKTGA